MEDGSLVEKDLWIDERRGVVLDSQVRVQTLQAHSSLILYTENFFYKNAASRQSHRHGGEHR